MKKVLFLLLFSLVSFAADVCAELLSGLHRNRAVVESSNFAIDRKFADYELHFGRDFVEALLRSHPGRLTHWVDLGAGNGIATRGALLSRVRLDPRFLKATAIGYEAPKDPAFEREKREIAGTLGEDRFRYLSGRYFSKIPPEEIGKADVITDLYGVLSYTENLSGDLEKALGALNPGGQLFTHRHPLGFRFIDASGRRMTYSEYLNGIGGIRVHSNNRVERTQGTLVVPRLKLVNFVPGKPPRRTFQIDEPFVYKRRWIPAVLRDAFDAFRFY